MSHPKTWCIVLVMANVLLIALLSLSYWSCLSNLGPGDIEDCGDYKEAIQVAQGAAREYLIVNDAESAVIDPDVTTTLFKRTGIWTVKGFATSEDSRRFHWVVVLAYHPSGTARDRWELVTVTSRLMQP